MGTWDVTKPADTDLVRNFPILNRADKQQLLAIFEQEHLNLSDGGGRHQFPVVTGFPTDLDGALIILANQLHWFSNGLWRNIEDFAGGGSAEFASGTRLPFDQDLAPTGWTRDVSINDRVIRIVGGARTPDGGDWLITGLTIASHTHGLAGHNHVIPTQGGVSYGVGSDTKLSGTGNTGGAIGDTDATVGGVSADGIWRPAFRDMIVCQKN